MTMPYDTTYSTWQYLRHRLHDGDLDPTFQAYADRHIREADIGTSTFYTTMLAKAGRDAAEATLQQWDRQNGRSAFANAIRAAGRGLLELVMTDRATGNKLVRMTDVSDRSPLPEHRQMRGLGKMLIWSVPAIGSTVSQWLGSDRTYGSNSPLGLQALVLSIYEVARSARLSLILPVRNESLPQWQRDSGFTSISLDRDGSARAHSLLPNPTGQLWQQALQLNDAPPLPFQVIRHAHLNRATGLPDTVRLLSDWLAGLEAHLCGVALASHLVSKP